MKTKTRNQLLMAFDELARSVGAESFEKGMEENCRWLREVLATMERFRTRRGLAKTLERFPEPTPEQLIVVQAACRFLPSFMRTEIPRSTARAAKVLPKQRGGRGRSLSTKQESEACRVVADLFAQGVRLRACKQRAALRLGVSVRTIERAWQNRKNHKAAQEPDLQSIMALLQEHLSGSSVATLVATNLAGSKPLRT